MYLLAHFLEATIATACFAILFNAPRKSLLSAGVSGGFGWLVFVYLRDFVHLSSINANLIAAVSIGLAAEIFARIQKQPVTMYVVPGIIVLVPGYSIFRAMNMFLYDALDEGLFILLRACTEAAAIAVGILIVGIAAKITKRRIK